MDPIHGNLTVFNDIVVIPLKLDKAGLRDLSVPVIDPRAVGKILQPVFHGGIDHDVVTASIHQAALPVHGVVAVGDEAVGFGDVVDPILNAGLGGAVDVVDVAVGVGDGAGVLGDAVDADAAVTVVASHPPLCG